MENVLIGRIIGYDAENGQVIAINEIYQEVVDEKEIVSPINKEDCDRFCETIQRKNSGKKIKTLVAPKDFNYDPETILTIKLEDESLQISNYIEASIK